MPISNASTPLCYCFSFTYHMAINCSCYWDDICININYVVDLCGCSVCLISNLSPVHLAFFSYQVLTFDLSLEGFVWPTISSALYLVIRLKSQCIKDTFVIVYSWYPTPNAGSSISPWDDDSCIAMFRYQFRNAGNVHA